MYIQLVDMPTLTVEKRQDPMENNDTMVLRYYLKCYIVKALAIISLYLTKFFSRIILALSQNHRAKYFKCHFNILLLEECVIKSLY